MITEEINDFVKNNSIATICCSTEGQPYCFNSFYSFIEKEGYLVFKSSSETRHTAILERNSSVAGTILPNNIDTDAIKGIQFEGIAMEEDEYSLAPATSCYYEQYPIGMTMPGRIWVIVLHSIKYTDNSKGFGYKKVWNKQDLAALI